MDRIDETIFSHPINPLRYFFFIGAWSFARKTLGDLFWEPNASIPSVRLGVTLDELNLWIK